jgi:hypothetical protein
VSALDFLSAMALLGAMGRVTAAGTDVTIFVIGARVVAVRSPLALDVPTDADRGALWVDETGGSPFGEGGGAVPELFGSAPMDFVGRPAKADGAGLDWGSLPLLGGLKGKRGHVPFIGGLW